MPATLLADLWVGVDVGTQSVRVLVADDCGLVASVGSAPLRSHRDAGTHEQQPADWWVAFGTACRQALAALPGPTDRIRGLAICGTSGTFLLADHDGTPRTAALMYDDARAGAEARDVAAAGADLWAALGYPMQRSWALPKLVWLLRHGPGDLRADLFAGRLRLLHCADFLAERLVGGPVATDWSHALKTGYDLDNQTWPHAVLDTLGLPAATFPDVVRPGAQLGTIGSAGSEHTGLPVGVPVRAGATDGCAAQIAAGALHPGSWNSVLGTTLVLKGVTETRLTDPAGAVYSHRHPDGGWLPGGASSVGAGVLAARFPDVDHDAMDTAAARYEPAGGLIYPLVSRGERFPFVDPAAEPFETGAFADDADRYGALLQGVAFVERLSLAHLGRLGAAVDGPLSITGGATRSRYWNQLRADVLGRELLQPGSPEPAFGMAVLAAAGEGNLTEAAWQMVHTVGTVAPRPGAHDRFGQRYAELVDALAARGSIDADLARYAKEEG